MLWLPGKLVGLQVQFWKVEIWVCLYMASQMWGICSTKPNLFLSTMIYKVIHSWVLDIKCFSTNPTTSVPSLHQCSQSPTHIFPSQPAILIGTFLSLVVKFWISLFQYFWLHGLDIKTMECSVNLRVIFMWGHADLTCIISILVYVLWSEHLSHVFSSRYIFLKEGGN